MTLVSVSAENTPALTLTFEGAAGGGTIRLTTTADRTGIVRAEVIAVQFPPCGGVSVLMYLDPPAPVTNGAFAFSFPFFDLPLLESLSFQGTFISETTIAGTARYSFFTRAGVGCASEEVAWTLRGPVDTPPGPDALVFVGSVKDGSGSITVTTDPSLANVTSLTLDSVSVPPCTDERGPLNVHAFFDPPVAVQPPDSSFEFGFRLAPTPSGLWGEATLVDAETMAGTLNFGTIPLDCLAYVLWNARLKGAPTPTPPPPQIQKLPPLQNLFLTRQGEKIPPVACAAGTDTALFEEVLSLPITSLDPKGIEPSQQLGAFELEVRFDPKLVCVNLEPGTAGDLMICYVDDKDEGVAVEGLARIGCITKGKDSTPPDTTTAEGRHLATITVRPQPELYSQLIANQDNGIVVQLLDQDCSLSDVQGHPIKIFSCDDADVTVRYLEGDVEPDCFVDALDQQAIAFRWGAEKGSLLYGERYDLEPSGFPAGGIEGDGDVDILDLQFVFGRHGSNCIVPWPSQPPVNPKL